MADIIIKRLTEGLVKVSFYDIQKAIENKENILLYYRKEIMELSWEGLKSKFGDFKEPPAGITKWDFKFRNNYKEEKKNKNNYLIDIKIQEEECLK